MDKLWIRVRDIRALLDLVMRSAVGAAETDRIFSSAAEVGMPGHAAVEVLGDPWLKLTPRSVIFGDRATSASCAMARTRADKSGGRSEPDRRARRESRQIRITGVTFATRPVDLAMPGHGSL
jgi:hypothetical protein